MWAGECDSADDGCGNGGGRDSGRDSGGAAGWLGSALSSVANPTRVTPTRVGIFGGSFDPPHVGHLLAASDAVEALDLDRLVFVPTAVQPLKHRGRSPAAGDARLAMVRALVGDDARFTVDALEIDRGGLSYTVETLETFERRWPGVQQFLLVGADVLSTFARWRDPLRVRALATLVVLVRAVDGVAGGGPDFPGGLPRRLATRRIAAGQSVRGFVPEGVAQIIRDGRLYQ